MSTRKSSVGTARRVVQKAHIPYRADEFHVGKKTGVVVDRVDRKSDGFEPFQDVVERLDRMTPPRATNNGRKKKKQSIAVEDDEDNEDGEMSMELTDTPVGAAYSHFTNNRRPPAPTSAKNSSRRLTRSSDIDFDKIPSPRPLVASKRQSLANGSAATPSTLSQPLAPTDDHDGGIDDSGFNDYGQPDDIPGGSSPVKASFTQMDRIDEEDGAEEQDHLDESSPIRPKKDKGKARATTPDEDDRGQDIEDDIAQGLDDVDQGDEDEDEEEEDVAPTIKKARTEKEKATKPRSRPRKRQVVQVERSPTPEGVRRSRRVRFRPLDWWRGEKLVYGRPETGEKILVANITEITRLPKQPVEPLGKHKRKRSAPPSKRKTTEPPDINNPEVDWDEGTQPHGFVVDFLTREEIERRVAFTSRMVAPKAAANNEWFFQKVFHDGDFIAAGQLMIPPGSRKPSKGTKDNTYVFYVIDGAVTVKIHNTSIILATGGMFMVPRGNTYFIENITDRNAKLFFTQARKIAMSEEEQASAVHFAPPRRSSESQRPMSRPPTTTTGRSSSAQVNGRESSSGVAAKS